MLDGVCLTYGRALGLDTYGDQTRGARVIELTEGLRDFESWIREETGQVADRFFRSQLLHKFPEGGHSCPP